MFDFFHEEYESRDYEAEERLLREKEKYFSFVRNGELENVKALLEKKPEMLTMQSNLRENALHEAVRADKSEIVDYLLTIVPEDKKEAFINARDNEGFTPLIKAVQYKNYQCAEILLKHKPQLDVVGYDTRRNVLHFAAANGNDKIIQTLLSVKDEGKPVLNVDQKIRGVNGLGCFGGFTALHVAAFSRSVNAAKALVENDADITAQTISGKTPLMIAYERSADAVVSYLLSLPQMDMRVKDTKGRDIAYYAQVYDRNSERQADVFRRVRKAKRVAYKKRSVRVKTDYQNE